jgi:integrase
MRSLVVRGAKDKETGKYEVITSEVDDLLITAQDSHYYPVIYTAVSSGLRQAELLGLRWRDIDIASRYISVNQVLYKRHGICQFNEPKTKHSRRKVKMTGKLAEFLGKYRLERERLYRQLGKTITLDDLVFANHEGQPMDAGVLSHAFGKIAKRASLENICFHDLRHTFASLMLLRGAQPKVVSEALGHSSVAFTMDVYSHILPDMQEDAMALLDEVLPVAKNSMS